MLFRLVPNRILPDAVAKIMARRGQAINRSPDDARNVGIDEAAFGKSGVEYQSRVLAAYLVRNSLKMNRLSKGVFVRFDVQKDRTDYVHVAFHSECAKAPNDPKLSDCGGRRGCCMAGGKAAAEAATVTPGAVRRSAWLGVADFRCSPRAMPKTQHKNGVRFVK